MLWSLWRKWKRKSESKENGEETTKNKAKERRRKGHFTKSFSFFLFFFLYAYTKGFFRWRESLGNMSSFGKLENWREGDTVSAARVLLRLLEHFSMQINRRKCTCYTGFVAIYRGLMAVLLMTLAGQVLWWWRFCRYYLYCHCNNVVSVTRIKKVKSVILFVTSIVEMICSLVNRDEVSLLLVMLLNN